MDMIYHYCGVETFLNILRNHTLRMSDLCKSTDRLELKSLLDVIKEKVLERHRKNNDFYGSVIYGMDMDAAFEFLTDRIIEKIKNDTDQMLFGTCFSENGDLLGQWREYADKGTGVAIGFDIKWFEQLSSNELFRFSKVTYGKENEAIVQKYADALYSEMLYAMKREESKRIITKDMHLSNLIQKCIYMDSIFLKKKEYENEQEWRLILDDENTIKSYDEWNLYYNWKNEKGNQSADSIQRLIPNGMEFMVKNGKIIPFLDLKFDLDKEKMPIKKIVIGSNCKVDKLDVYHLLGFYKYDSETIQIEKSESSYCF